MTEEMLAKSRSRPRRSGFVNVEFREGIVETCPLRMAGPTSLSQRRHKPLCRQATGVCGNRAGASGGRPPQFADIANGKPVPPSAVANVDCGPHELPVVCRVQPGKK